MQVNTNNNRQSWLTLGLRAIGEEGLGSLKINELCLTLNVTKGCFYHWFKSKGDYEEQIIGYWKHRLQTTLHLFFKIIIWNIFG